MSGGASRTTRSRAPVPTSPVLGDAVGLALLVAGAGWTLLAARAADVDGLPGLVGVYAAVLAAYSGSRLLSRLDAAAVPVALVVVGVTVIVVTSPGEVYSSVPLDGPFGYANASGSFFLQCALGGALLLFDRRPVLRIVGAAASLAFAAVPLATGTTTAAGVLVLVPAMWLVRWAVGTRRTIDLCGVLLVAALLVSGVIAATYSGADQYEPDAPRSGVDRLIDATLSLRRVELQHDALQLMVDEPVTGVGPDRFGEESAAAARDPDSPYAHHGFLQVGAETGVPGLVLLLLVFAWALARVRTSISRRRRSVLVAVALLALGVHASVEYVLQFAAIPAVAAALVGCAVDLHPRRGRPTRADREEP